MPFEEAQRAGESGPRATFYQEALEESREWRDQYKQRKGVIRAEDMPWEESPQGELKHIVNEKMGTRECAVDAYMQVIAPGSRSGKHRHMWEEVFYVLEGEGYDLHWDPTFDCDERYTWGWAEEARRYDWSEGDFVYIPPYAVHQHFNASEARPARILSASNRLVKATGYNWLDQLERAPQS